MINPEHKFIPLGVVKEMTSLSRSTIYRLMHEGDFPKLIKMSHRRSTWVEAEVIKWMESRMLSR